MEVCEYPCSEHDSSSILSQLGSHSQETVSQMPAPQLLFPAPQLPLPVPSPMEKCDQIVVLDSSRIAMQIASGQIVWPIVPKPKDISPKLEPDVQQIHPFAIAVTNGALHSDLESTDLVLGQGDTPVEKCKVRKRSRSASEDAEVHDGDGPNEKQAIMRWKDVWVAQLIHIRGRMQVAFSGPQKQRVDLWQVVKTDMARTCYGFDKDSEACRKKWRRVYKEYKDDKHLHVAGHGSQKCRFYDLMEFYMGERANGVCDPPPLTAIGFSIPLAMAPVKDEMLPVTNEIGETKAKDSTALLHASLDPYATEGTAVIERYDVTQESSGRFYVSEVDQVPPITGEARAMKKPHKRAKRHATGKASTVDMVAPNSLPSMLAELVSIGKEMLQTTRQFEQEKLDVLHSLKEALHEISKKI